MKELLVFPTWFIVSLVVKFNLLPKNNPLRGKEFTLKEWYNNSTALSKAYDFAFWMNGSCLLYCFYVIHKYHH